jgi:predicted SprT family Zn-dependent metalloprotease
MWSSSSLEQARDRALEAVGAVAGLASWPRVPIAWNRRLRRAGRAVIEGPRGRVRSTRIELSPAYFEVYPQDLHGILVHEAVHVGLALLGRPFGHGPDFRRLCRAAGGLLHGRPLPGRVLRYRCPVCAMVLERRRHAASGRWCARCVESAQALGQDAFRPERALVLVGVAFLGVEAVHDPSRRQAPEAAAGQEAVPPGGAAPSLARD